MGNGVKLLHTSDWHLGKLLNGQPLISEQASILRQIEEAMSGHDALLIAGDIFDRAVPNVEAVELFSGFINRIVEKGKPVVIIAGNHDSPQRLGYADRTLEKKGVHVRCGYDRLAEPITVRSDDGNEVDVFALPFVESMKMGEALGNPSIGDHAKATAAAVAAINAGKRAGVPSVLMTHAFVAGKLETSESERMLFVGNQGQVPAETFAGFDYVALGHLHTQQSAIGDGSVRYSGSIFPYSFSEANRPKYMLSVALEGGAIKVQNIELKLLKRVIRIKGTIDELLGDSKFEPMKNEYICAELTDPQVVMNSHSKLKARFPFVLEISQTSLPIGAAQIEPARIAEASESPEKLFELFLESRGYEDEDAKKASKVFEELMEEIERAERDG